MNTTQTNKVNRAVNKAFKALRQCAETVAKAGSPVRSINFSVADKGQTRARVTYKGVSVHA